MNDKVKVYRTFTVTDESVTEGVVLDCAPYSDVQGISLGEDEWAVWVEVSGVDLPVPTSSSQGNRSPISVMEYCAIEWRPSGNHKLYSIPSHEVARQNQRGGKSDCIHVDTNAVLAVVKPPKQPYEEVVLLGEYLGEMYTGLYCTFEELLDLIQRLARLDFFVERAEGYYQYAPYNNHYHRFLAELRRGRRTLIYWAITFSDYLPKFVFTEEEAKILLEEVNSVAKGRKYTLETLFKRKPAYRSWPGAILAAKGVWGRLSNQYPHPEQAVALLARNKWVCIRRKREEVSTNCLMWDGERFHFASLDERMNLLDGHPCKWPSKEVNEPFEWAITL